MMTRLLLPAAHDQRQQRLVKKKDTVTFFQNNTLYRDVNDKMLEQRFPRKMD